MKNKRAILSQQLNKKGRTGRTRGAVGEETSVSFTSPNEGSQREVGEEGGEGVKFGSVGGGRVIRVGPSASRVPRKKKGCVM